MQHLITNSGFNLSLSCVLGADVNTSRSIHYAVANNKVEVLSFLVKEMGGNVNLQGNTQYYTYIHSHTYIAYILMHTNSYTFIHSHTYIHSFAYIHIDEHGSTPLHIAACLPSLLGISTLLALGIYLYVYNPS